MRIVSLIPSATEIVCALGFQDQLVGRSHECDYPENVENLPACCQPKFSTKGTSAEIHSRVQELVSKSLSVYRVDTEKLKALRPDIIVTQDHCDVCAVSLEAVEQAVCELIESKPKIVTLRPAGLSDVWSGFQKVADALGVPGKGKEVVEQSRQRMKSVSEKARKISENPSVACVEWFDPLMMASNWMPELLTMLGARDLFGVAGAHAPRVKWEDLQKADPGTILIMPCGWNMERSRNEIHLITEKPGWKDLKAVRDGKVYLTESNQYFNRPGPRLVDSLEIMAEILYPETFRFGYEGSGWQKL
jgi:iron complex transport system substrate-binding protein